jgi:hypothetical protein
VTRSQRVVVYESPSRSTQGSKWFENHGRSSPDRTVREVRDSKYFQDLNPADVPAELEHYGVDAAALASCVAPCGCCVVASDWAAVGDPAVWFEVWWLWFAHRATLETLCG